ncbi:hypothetical protein [Sphingomicrobium marinum]|uniref:hypothetical protein n=1 Tax=Sphingomicrobium marinum TaxID=1227950 RepID=UPI00223F1088|nr:hypothetical protein [Sphingomicrobium marinum]
MTQITGRMPSEDREKFGDYSAKVGLDGSSVATLLVLRELQLRRLHDLRARLGIPNNFTEKKITSHRVTEEQKTTFTKHAKDIGLSNSKALGLLCRAELIEQWVFGRLWSDSD